MTIWWRVAWWISKATRAQAHARARALTRTHTQTRTHALTHAHERTHAEICNTDCFSTATFIRQSASALGYTYIVCLV